MKQRKPSSAKEFDLGPSGSVVMHLSADSKRLLIDFKTDPKGFDKTGVNTFIEALEKVRKRMER